MESLIFIISNSKQLYYIEYILIAKYMGLSFNQISNKVKSELFVQNESSLRKDTFDKYMQHTFRAIIAYEHSNSYDNIPELIKKSLLPL